MSDFKLDKIDRRIIFELDSDARAGFAELARRLKLGEQNVRYRVSRLFELGVIRRCHAVVDAGRIGLQEHKFYFKLRNNRRSFVEKMTASIADRNETIWLAQCSGQYDLAAVFRVSDLNSLNQIANDIFADFGTEISSRTILAHIHSSYLSRNYLVEDSKKGPEILSSSCSGVLFDLDTLDKAIIRLLEKDARNSAADLLRILSQSKADLSFRLLSREALLKRIRRLEKAKVITGYTCALNHDLLGQTYSKLLIKLSSFGTKATAQLIKSISSQARITRVLRYLGDWDIEFNLECRTVNERRGVVAQILDQHHSQIGDHSIVEVVSL